MHTLHMPKCENLLNANLCKITQVSVILVSQNIKKQANLHLSLNDKKLKVSQLQGALPHGIPTIGLCPEPRYVFLMHTTNKKIDILGHIKNVCHFPSLS